MPDIDIDGLVTAIIKSPEADRMRRMVTEGFYDRSRIGLWMFEVIGREYDSAAQWSRGLRYEAFPLTCTWSIEIWEFVCGIEPDVSLTLDARRLRLMIRKWTWPPVNPARIERAVSYITGSPVKVTEHVRPYTFRVETLETGGPGGTAGPGGVSVNNYALVVKTLQDIKQSHLSYEFWRTITTEFEREIHIGGVAFPGVMITVLPPYAPADGFDMRIHVRAFRASVMTTDLDMLSVRRRVVLQVDGAGVKDAVLQLNNGDVKDMYLDI